MTIFTIYVITNIMNIIMIILAILAGIPKIQNQRITSKLTLWTSKADLFKIISCRVMPAKMAKTILKMMFVMFVITKMVKMIFFMIGRPGIISTFLSFCKQNALQIAKSLLEIHFYWNLL